jgi:glycerol-3-phosphate cytidylyltransferase
VIVGVVIPEKSWEQKLTDVQEYNVTTFVMGHDWEGKFDFLKSKCEVCYLPRTKNVSSSKIKVHIAEGKKTQIKADF